MSINLICQHCRSTYRLSTKACPGCSRPLTTYKVRVLFPDGRAKTKQTTSLKQAKAIEAKFKTTAIDEGVLGIRRAAPTVAEAAAAFLNWARQNKRSWKDDHSRYRLYLRDAIGKLRLDQVTPRHIQKIIDTLTSRRGLSPATVRQAYQLLNRIYSFSIKQGTYTGQNPLKRIEIPKVDNQGTRHLSPEEADRLLKVLSVDSNVRAVLVVRFGLLTGRRRGEVLHLEWPDVDLSRGFVTFRGLITKNKTTQTIPVCREALEVLKEASRLRVSGLVFPAASGRHYHSFDRTWRRIRRKAGLKDLRFHDLRHSFASFLASSGSVDLYTLQRLLGHKTIGMTQRYAHLFEGALRDAAGVMDGVVRG